MDPLVALGLLGFFGATLTLAAVGFDYVTTRHRDRGAVRQLKAGAARPAGAAGEAGPVDVRGRELDVSTLQRVIAPAIRRFGRLGRRMTPLDVIERLGLELEYAGSPTGWDAERILAFKLFLPLAGIGLVAAFSTLTQPPFPFVLIGMFLFGAVGYYAPEWILRSRSGERQKQMQRALPDSLDLLSITVEAGLAFDAALARVARNVRGPLGEELFRVVQEMQLGKGRAAALRAMADRSTVDDLRSFVLAMVQADQFGVPIARVLKVQSEEIRLRRRQRAEEAAQKLPVKIVFPVVLCIFPSIFVILLGPAMIQIYDALLS